MSRVGTGATLIFLLQALCSVVQAQGVEETLAEVRRLMVGGDYAQAEQRLQSGSDPRLLRWRIELALRRGDFSSAERDAQNLLGAYQLGRLQTAEALAAAAYAAWTLDRWHDSNEIFLQAAEAPNPRLPMYVDWGNLYLQQYNPSEALDIFKDGLGLNQDPQPWDRWTSADAYIGIASAQSSLGMPGSDEVLAKAEEAEPDNLDLIALRAQQAVREADWEVAAKEIDRGRKQNRHYLPLLRAEAASHYFQNQSKAFEKLEKRLLEINAREAALYEMLGDLCVRRRRPDEAVNFFRKAVANNPRQWSAVASLGINLMRMGEEEEGKAVLERAYANDPFNIWTVNTLKLVDSFDRFTRFETPHFIVRLETEEVAALRPYVEELLERSLSTLEKKYGYEITDKWVFEMYGDHEDFAVRALGLPGLGALGAAFGKVVAMDSPSARPKGQFHWGSTLWHEVTHVVTLSLSQQKVPRWFTEGISMLEERLAGEGWGEFITADLVSAWKEDKLLSVGELNSGFERPRFAGQLGLSYLQAGWLCQFLNERYGSQKVRDMLVAYGQDKSEAEVFESVLGDSLEQVDALFQEEMKKLLEPLASKLEPIKGSGHGVQQLQEAAFYRAVIEHPENYWARINLAAHLIETDQPERAAPHLEKAIEIFPYAAGGDSPYPLLASIYRKNGEREALTSVLSRWWKKAPQRADNGLELSQLLIEQERPEEARAVLESIMYVDPLQPQAHQLLGDLYLQADRPERAVDEFKILVALGPADRAGAHYRLAQALAGVGQPKEARRQVLMALEIAPTYSQAQKLLLELVRQ